MSDHQSSSTAELLPELNTSDVVTSVDDLSFPIDFLRRFKMLCPDEYQEAAVTAFSQPKVPSFRVSQLVDPEQTALTELSEEIEVQAVEEITAVDIFQCKSKDRQALTHSNAAADGRLYIQSLASMLAALVLDPQTNDWVLDLAAAPGGKTILLAEMMKNQGKISAVEPIKQRFFRLKANLDRMGITNTRCYLKDGRAIGTLKPNTFNRVLLDAPCSSESRFRHNDKSSINHWSLNKVRDCSKKQKRLIISAYNALKPGGQMVYSTCSFSPEENEMVVAQLLKKFPEARCINLIDTPLVKTLSSRMVFSEGRDQWRNKNLPEECKKTLRVWPSIESDGFFLALIKKPEAMMFNIS